MSGKGSGSFKDDDSISIESIGLGPKLPPQVDSGQFPKMKEFSNSKLEPEGDPPMDEYLYNCIVYVIHCPKHQKVALSLSERSKAVWLPFVPSPYNKTWSDATTEGISIIFSKEDSELDPRLIVIPVKSISCLHVLRIQLPMTRKFIYRLIQMITLGNDTDTFQCCISSKHLQWIDVSDAINGNIYGLWGPEVPMYVSFIIEPKPQEISEYGLEQVMFNIPKDRIGKNPEEKLLIDLQLHEKDVEQIYSDFLEHCFPSFYMTYWSFNNYISDYIQEYENPDAALQLFQAFNYNKNGFLSFHQFFFGIASIEPDCPTNEIRLKFIFRYYDTDKDDLLSREELLKLLFDLSLSARECEDITNRLALPLDWHSFSEMIERDKLKTDPLCRSSSPILLHICRNFQKRNNTRISEAKRTMSTVSSPHKTKGPCLACRERKYQFGGHCVRFDQAGRCAEPRHILESDEVETEEEKNDEMTMYKYSQDYIFSTVSIGHTFLDMIREFNMKSSREKLTYFTGEIEIFVSYVKIICQNVRSLFECEAKLIKINSSAFIIGDILGDLPNLLVMEGALWQSVPVIPSNYVFLGNYIGGGQYGIECLLYLFALKIIAPNKFFLLRGVNEAWCRAREKNEFKDECSKKYGLKNGSTIYETVNETFSRMTLAVVIDESIFCVNNNVPDPATKLDDFMSLPKDLRDPWQFPIAKAIFSSTKCSDEQTAQYLTNNGLTHVIRANQHLDRGFYIGNNDKSITVNSMKNSTGKKDLTAVCVDGIKIQIVKIDTNGINRQHHRAD